MRYTSWCSSFRIQSKYMWQIKIMESWCNWKFWLLCIQYWWLLWGSGRKSCIWNSLKSPISKWWIHHLDIGLLREFQMQLFLPLPHNNHQYWMHKSQNFQLHQLSIILICHMYLLCILKLEHHEVYLMMFQF